LLSKVFLGVKLRTPNDLVYGDTGRYPIVINSVIRCIKYWLKLVKMPDLRLPRKAYRLDERKKNNWATKIRMFLFLHGFGFVWLKESPIHACFLFVLKEVSLGSTIIRKTSINSSSI